MKLFTPLTSLVLVTLPIKSLAFTEPSELVSCQDGGACNFCDIVQTILNVTQWIGFISILIAVILFMYAGYRMTASRGDISVVTEARKMMGNVAIGILIIIISWTLVDTLLKTLTGGGFGFWNDPRECGGQKETGGLNTDGIQLKTYDGIEIVPDSAYSPGGIYAEEGPATAPSGAVQSHIQALTVLNAAGISVASSGNCSDRNNRTCTSLDGISQQVITDAINLRASCNCNITITGGTEVGHAAGPSSHSSGVKYDVGRNSALNSYIVNNFIPSGTRGDGARLYTDPNSGSVYANEGDHWDILVR